MQNLTVTFQRIQDTSNYDFKGDRARVRRYTFYIGTHGPFIEDVPLDPTFDPSEIERRVAVLTQHLAPK